MNTRLSILGNETVDLNIDSILKNIPDNFLFHSEHGSRHPLAIFNISTRRVYKAFLKFLTNYDDINDKIDSLNFKSNPYSIEMQELNSKKEISAENSHIEERISELKDILESISKEKSEIVYNLHEDYKEVLDSIMAFIDDTYHILKALYPKATVSKNIQFADRWLECADRNTKFNYSSALNEYRKVLAPRVNKIKHNHARVNQVRFLTNKGKILGYYIEGTDPQSGAICPDHEVHSKFNGEYTAISFNYDLKYHLLGFFHTMECLSKSIESIIYKKYKTKIKISNSKIENKEWYEIIKKIASNKSLFFIDEYNKKIPEISIDESKMEVKFSHYKKTNTYSYSGQYAVESSANSDGVTRSFAIPYYSRVN